MHHEIKIKVCAGYLDSDCPINENLKKFLILFFLFYNIKQLGLKDLNLAGNCFSAGTKTKPWTSTDQYRLSMDIRKMIHCTKINRGYEMTEKDIIWRDNYSPEDTNDASKHHRLENVAYETAIEALRMKHAKFVKIATAAFIVLAVIIVIASVFFVVSYSTKGKSKNRIRTIVKLIKSADEPRFESRYLVQMLNAYYVINNEYPKSLREFTPEYISEELLNRLNERYIYEVEVLSGDFKIKPFPNAGIQLGKPFLTKEDIIWKPGGG